MINHRIQLGKIIQTVRKARGYNSVDKFISDDNELEISPMTMIKIERGDDSVRESSIHRVLEALDIQLPMYTGTIQEETAINNWLERMTNESYINDINLEIQYLNDKLSEARLYHNIKPLYDFIIYLPLIPPEKIADLYTRIHSNNYSEISYINAQVDYALSQIPETAAKAYADAIKQGQETDIEEHHAYCKNVEKYIKTNKLISEFSKR